MVDPDGLRPWYGNYAGPGNNGDDVAPINSVDAAARDHDLAYGAAGADGIVGAFFDTSVANADLALAYNVLEARQNDRELNPIDKTAATVIAGFFGTVGTVKLIATLPLPIFPLFPDRSLGILGCSFPRSKRQAPARGRRRRRVRPARQLACLHRPLREPVGRHRASPGDCHHRHARTRTSTSTPSS